MLAGASPHSGLCLLVQDNRITMVDYHFYDEPADLIEEIVTSIRFDKKLQAPKTGQKKVSWCKKCGEPTTHKFQIDGKVKKEVWVCLCCESDKSRTKKEVRMIKKTRKGWAQKSNL